MNGTAGSSSITPRDMCVAGSFGMCLLSRFIGFHMFAQRLLQFFGETLQTASSLLPASSQSLSPNGSTIATTRNFLFLVLSLPSFAVLAACTAIWVTSRPATVMRRTSFHLRASASSRRRPAPTIQSQHVSSGRPRRRCMAKSTVLTSHTFCSCSIAAKGSSAASRSTSTALPTSSGSSNGAALQGFLSSLPSRTACVSTAERGPLCAPLPWSVLPPQSPRIECRHGL